jgi:hypothetical protein
VVFFSFIGSLYHEAEHPLGMMEGLREGPETGGFTPPETGGFTPPKTGGFTPPETGGFTPRTLVW